MAKKRSVCKQNAPFLQSLRPAPPSDAFGEDIWAYVKGEQALHSGR